MELQQRSKRPRLEGETPANEKNMLTRLLEERRWEEATLRSSKCPEEASTSRKPSPLALACRLVAPYECVKAILDAAPDRLRHVLDSRGTPLHEAIVCENTETNVFEALLKADEALGNETTRATLLQDVDGFTPLHLLIRRRFQAHILTSESGEDSSLMPILEMLVSSCPEAVLIPDRGEYEEPPIVYAIKANIYAPALGSEDATLARVELQIYEMVACMLKHCPQAASRVLTGYRGQYTALHSAVFHGRYTSTIDLLLRTEAEHPSAQKAALLANTQGEMPLHFCAMRCERPRTVALIAKAAPLAVLKRDASGLTPLHWLWIRFVSTLMTLDGDGRGNDTTIRLDTTHCVKQSRYSEFAALEQGDFDMDLPLIKRLDPPVDFLRMRHIPLEVLGESVYLQGADSAVDVLKQIRERYFAQQAAYGDSSNVEQRMTTWNRREVVISLFWTKVVSLLEAAKAARADYPIGESTLIHTAFASPCCPVAVAHIVTSLYPEELMVRDERGRLPVHYAASRAWHAWDWPRDDVLGEPAAAKLLLQESLRVVRTALNLSPPKAIRIADNDGRLVLHDAIDNLVRACTRPGRSMADCPLEGMLQLLHDLVQIYPDSLSRRDGRSKLYPFLQATAVATECEMQAHAPDELPLSITFELLRENPTLLFSTHETPR